MIALTKIRGLDLNVPPQAGRAAHLSAASGLVRAGSYFYVAADDELSLGCFAADEAAPGDLIELLPGELPLDPAERKAQKPDFESVLRLPPFAGFDHGALFVLGSASKKTRRSGVLLSLDGAGAVSGAARRFDLAGMLQPLKNEFDKLNIEGAVVCGEELRLLQRGNKKNRTNAVIRCKVAPLLEALSEGRAIAPLELLAVAPVELGDIDGVPLSFTDAATLANGDVLFSAAAEDTEDSYDDGACLGSAIGIASPQGNLKFLERIDKVEKIEGIEARETAGQIEFYAVTDADDGAVAASMFRGSIARPG